MRRPSGITAIVVVAIALFAGWIASNTEWGEVKLPTPLRGDAATNPFYAAQKLVETLGATSERRQSLGDTSTDAVIVLSTWGWDISHARRAEFERWVEAGGRLVVDAALITGSDAFGRWSGIERQREEPERAADRDLFETPEIIDACQELQAISYESGRDDAPLYYEGCNFDLASRLVSSRGIVWALSVAGDIQAARVRVGAGAVTVVNAVPFVYRELLEGDHAEVFVAAANLRTGDHVVFMSEEDVSSLLELVWQHGAPVVAVLSLWIALALWRGATRFGPLVAPPERARRSLAEQIRGTGRFAVRVGGGAALTGAVRRALHEAAVRRIAGYERMPNAEQIAAVAGLTGVNAGELAAALDSSPQRSTELRGKLALLESVRRQLVSGSQWSKHGKRI